MIRECRITGVSVGHAVSDGDRDPVGNPKELRADEVIPHEGTLELGPVGWHGDPDLGELLGLDEFGEHDGVPLEQQAVTLLLLGLDTQLGGGREHRLERGDPVSHIVEVM